MQFGKKIVKIMRWVAGIIALLVGVAVGWFANDLLRQRHLDDENHYTKSATERPLEPQTKTPAEMPPPELIPQEALNRITGNANLGFGTFSGVLYNGSHWVVTDIVFHVAALEDDGQVRWERSFREPFTLEPLTAQSFSVDVAGERGASARWSIVAAQGYRPDPQTTAWLEHLEDLEVKRLERLERAERALQDKELLEWADRTLQELKAQETPPPPAAPSTTKNTP